VVLLQPGRPRRDGFRRRLIDAALRFFGDPDPAAGSPWDKGERLARRAGGERALLVLDGLEPLQSRHAFDRGKLRDPALASLLCGLARQSEGLCLITTREPLSDLAGLAAVSARGLEQITPEAGRALLRTARVVGTDAELEDLARRFGPHALAVSLLGVYLYENDPRHGAGAARALEQLPGDAPLDRVLAGFEQWLATSADLEVLRLLGLFDRPACPPAPRTGRRSGGGTPRRSSRPGGQRKRRRFSLDRWSRQVPHAPEPVVRRRSSRAVAAAVEGPAARRRAQACLEPGRRAGMADIRVVSCEVSARRQIPAQSKRRQD
jgi:hypothetical protein